MLPAFFLIFTWTGLVAFSLFTSMDYAMLPLLSEDVEASNKAGLGFSTAWHVLGPFRLGTREAIWGNDPLERLGGFRNTPYDKEAKFGSPLGRNGSVSWTIVDVPCSAQGSCAVVELQIDFQEQDWLFARSVYGWAALQYQAWARGSLTVKGPSPQKIQLFTDNILEFWVNDEQVFGGDFYGFRRAPLVLSLLPGDHIINLRLVRDVRAMGASEDPSTVVTLEACIIPRTLMFLEKSLTISDLVEGKLPSPLASIDVRNTGDEWVELLKCMALEGINSVEMLAKQPLQIAPGQTRRIGLKLNFAEKSKPEVAMTFEYKTLLNSSSRKSQVLRTTLKSRTIRQPHKTTFLHPSGAVSYTIIRAPSFLVSEKQPEDRNPLPVLLNLHGAGLEADSHQVRHMLDAVPHLPAFVIFPTGMSAWSGDDWHTWGFADVAAAVSAICDWMREMEWVGPGVSTENWVVSGHSNGGQGTWFILSHEPDKVIAAAAASGYLSIQSYVPYQMWREAPPLLTTVVQNSMTNFRHELLVDNFAGIPILQQHGSDDDNVPPYHSRLMSSLLRETGFPSEYIELPRTGHWFAGAMTTEALKGFYHRHLKPVDSVLSPPERFSTIYPGSGDMGSHWGIFVDQVETPDNFGRIAVHRHIEQSTWHIKSSNVRRLHFDFRRLGLSRPSAILLDNCDKLFLLNESSANSGWFEKSKNDMWSFSSDDAWKNLQARYGRQRGAMDAIMKTTDTFKIAMCSEETFDVALEISRNLFQYFAADSAIVACGTEDMGGAGNVITIATGQDVPVAQLESFPIKIFANRIELQLFSFAAPKKIQVEAGLGAIFLRPLEQERLELVVWGFDKVGLRQAARLVPTLTGVGQADFIILSDEGRWKGHAGALAMGFFDYEWGISSGSYVP